MISPDEFDLAQSNDVFEDVRARPWVILRREISPNSQLVLLIQCPNFSLERIIMNEAGQIVKQADQNLIKELNCGQSRFVQNDDLFAAI